MEASSVSDSAELSDIAARFKVAVAILLMFAVALGSGCVVTAECDDTVRCEGERVCYDTVCRPICETTEDCANPDAVCTPCRQDDTEGAVNHCHQAEVALSACVEEDS